MTNILVCTLGASWPVIPEVFGWLAPSRLDLYRDHPEQTRLSRMRDQHALAEPDELWVCTTEGDQTLASLKNLTEWWRELGDPMPLRIWRAAGTDQLANAQECTLLRELTLRTVLLATERAGSGGQVVLSLAGGRKTMSADLQWAGSLFGSQAWLHVVGPEPLPKGIMSPNPRVRPDELHLYATIQRFLAPLPEELAKAVTPLVVGRGLRDELMDLEIEGRRVDSANFPLPLADPECRWPFPEARLLMDEIDKRQRESHQLLGNFLVSLSADERHENWRSLYRLPPRLIEQLRRTPLRNVHEAWVRLLPKADLHRHVGGCLDLAAQIDVGQAIWSAMTAAQRREAQAVVGPLLERTDWDWDWPQRVKSCGDRAHATAALLVGTDPAVLRRQLFESTEPRVNLKASARGFAAYERPGELSGSAVLGHPAAIPVYARHIVRQAVDEGLVYAELRGSPQKYVADGLDFLQRFAAALDTEARLIAAETRPRFRFIIIADRRRRDDLKSVIDLAVRAKRELPDFVVGLDLAGDEGTNEPEALAPDFLPAFEACLPVTIHAGEGEPADSIWQAAYHLHADRIGHGLTIKDHSELASRFRDRRICLELCPSSNREVVGFRDPDFPQTEAMPAYPLHELWQLGLPLTLCTDNPGISQTDLVQEYLTAARMVDASGRSLTQWDALAMIKQAFAYSFLPSHEKEALMKQADAKIHQLLAGATLL